MRVTFDVTGLPATKGSTKSFRHPHTGRVVTLSDNARLAGWERAVAVAAKAAGAWITPDAVRVSLVFRLPRPQSHVGARGLRPSAPAWPTTKPDLDKLTRAILDGLTGVAYVDDSQVVEILARKIYAAQDEQPGVSVTFELAGEG